MLCSFWRIRNVSAGPTTLATQSHRDALESNRKMYDSLSRNTDRHVERWCTWCLWSCWSSGVSCPPAAPAASPRHTNSEDYKRKNIITLHVDVILAISWHTLASIELLTSGWWLCTRTPPCLLCPPPVAIHALSGPLRVQQEQPAEPGMQKEGGWHSWPEPWPGPTQRRGREGRQRDQKQEQEQVSLAYGPHCLFLAAASAGKMTEKSCQQQIVDVSRQHFWQSNADIPPSGWRGLSHWDLSRRTNGCF